MMGTGLSSGIPGLWRQFPSNLTFHLSFQRCWFTRQEVGQLYIGDRENKNLVGQVTIGDTGSFLRRR